MKGRVRLWLLCMVVLGLISSLVLFAAVQKGLGVVNDSIAYLGGADSLLAGKGYRQVWLVSQEPITHFPPLFSVLLAIGGGIGFEITTVAFWVIITLFGVNTILGGLVAWRITGKGWVGLLASLLLASNHNVLRVHSALMSEPLFLFLSLLIFLLLDRYIHSRRLVWLFTVGILVGLAFLTRYIAAAFIPLVVLVVWLVLRREGRVVTGWLVFGLGALPLMIGWLARNGLVGDSITNRQFIWHPLHFEKINFGLQNLWTLFLPSRVVDWMAPYQTISNLLLACAGIALLFWLAWLGVWIYQQRVVFVTHRRWADLSSGIVILWSLFAYSFIYLAAMILSMSVYDAATIFEHRILVPVYCSILIGIVVLAGWLWEQRGIGLRLIVLVSCLGFLSLSTWNQARNVSAMQYDAQGFASRIWNESELFTEVRSLNPTKEIYTNKPTLLYFQTGRMSNVLPTPYDISLGLERTRYDSDLELLRLRADQERAAIIIFGWEWMDSPEGESWYHQIIAGLTAVKSTPEGTMFLAHP